MKSVYDSHPVKFYELVVIIRAEGLLLLWDTWIWQIDTNQF